MSDFLSRFGQALVNLGCGITVDAHKTQNSFDVVQYLWAAPLDSLDNQNVDSVISQVLSAARSAGFEAADVTPHVTHLPNETAVLENCPFQPGMCSGEHLVITGSGKAS